MTTNATHGLRYSPKWRYDAGSQRPRIVRSSRQTVLTASTLGDRNVEQTSAIVDRTEVSRENKRDDGLKLHHNIERRARGVLERVAHGVTSHCRIVGGHVLTLQSWVRGIAHADVLLAIVPSPPRIRHRDG